MRIISITNQKGGCGKTTTAVNLAASLAANDKKVLLIDLDPQSHASLGLNIEYELSIYNVLSKLATRSAELKDIIKPVSTHFDIAPSSIILSTLEQELAGEISRESRLKEVLENFKGDYDYVLIDCPPNLGILTINAICASAEVIIPVEASRFSLEGLSQLLQIINLVRDRLDHKVKNRVLVTNFDSRLHHSFTMLDQIKSTFKNCLYSTIVHVNVKLKESQSQGTHILNYDKYCRGAKDYFSLSREIITQETPGATGEIRMPELEKKMRSTMKEHLPKLKEIFFTVKAPEAHEVYIAGDFNGWQLDDTSRMQQEDGSWTKRMNLGLGTHHYRFVIDGKWTEDPGNPEAEVNPYGEKDSLIKV